MVVKGSIMVATRAVDSTHSLLPSFSSRSLVIKDKVELLPNFTVVKSMMREYVSEDEWTKIQGMAMLVKLKGLFLDDNKVTCFIVILSFPSGSLLDANMSSIFFTLPVGLEHAPSPLQQGIHCPREGRYLRVRELLAQG